MATRIRGNTQIINDTVGDAQIAASANILTSKLAGGSAFLKSDGNVTATSDLNMGGFKLTDVANGENANDLINVSQLNAVSIELDLKGSVRAASTTNYAINLVKNNFIMDGITLAINDRVLLKNQTDQTQNGIYVIQDTTNPVRSSDADSTSDVNPGMFLFVEEGLTNENSGWVLNTNGIITLEVSGLIFNEFAAPGAIITGSGISRSGSVFNVNIGNGTEISSDLIQLNLDSATLKLGINGLALNDLTDSNVLVGNSSNLGTEVVFSGDILMNTTGIVSISSEVLIDADFSSIASIISSKLADALNLLRRDGSIIWDGNLNADSNLLNNVADGDTTGDLVTFDQLDPKLDDTQLVTDDTFIASTDTELPSALAVKTYTDTEINKVISANQYGVAMTGTIDGANKIFNLSPSIAEQISEPSFLLRSNTFDTDTSFSNEVGPHSINPIGLAQHSTNQAKFNSSSISLPNATSYLTVSPINTALTLINGDFTIDFWVYLNAIQPWTTAFSFNNPLSIQLIIRNGSLDVLLNNTARAEVAVGFTINTWNHIAITRISSNITIWFNGAFVKIKAIPGGILNASTEFSIGQPLNGWVNGINGYIEEFRITQGDPLWTSDFSSNLPEAYKLAAKVEPRIYQNGLRLSPSVYNTESNFDNLLAHFDEADSSTRFDREGRLETISNVFSFGANDYTIECFFKIDNINISYQKFIAGKTDRWSLGMSHIVSRRLGMYLITNFTIVRTGSTDVVPNVWNHAAISRNGDTWRLYLNGNLEESYDGPTGFVMQDDDINIGSTFQYFRGILGNIRNVRVTTSAGLYPAAFTAPVYPILPTTLEPIAYQLPLDVAPAVDTSPNNLTVTGVDVVPTIESIFVDSGDVGFDIKGIKNAALNTNDSRFGEGSLDVTTTPGNATDYAFVTYKTEDIVLGNASSPSNGLILNFSSTAALSVGMIVNVSSGYYIGKVVTINSATQVTMDTSTGAGFSFISVAYWSLEIRTEDFTLDFWLKNTTGIGVGITDTIIGNWDNTINSWRVRWDASKNIYFEWHDGAIRSTVPITFPSDTNWHHIAVTRTSSNIYVFVDGTLGTTYTGAGVDQSLGNESDIRLGEANVLLDEVRLLIGTAFKTSDFSLNETAWGTDLIIDYDRSGDTITFEDAPLLNDVIRVDYRT